MPNQHAEDIAKSLYVLAAEKIKPLVVIVDKHDQYVSHYGNLNHYHLPEYIKGEECIDDFAFLVGLEAEPYIELPLVTLNNDVVAKINVLTINERRYIILFDANAEFGRQKETMQGSNETKLLNTKLQNLTAQLQLTQENLEKKNQLLNLANESKSRFISSMSHEFRTPISAILGFSNLLSENPSSNKLDNRHTRAIERNANYLLSLIDNVLEHAQLERDKVLINKSPLNLKEFINDVESLFETHVKESSITFCVNIDKSVPQAVLTDRIRLQQILINLIANAFKYTENGSIKVDYSWQDGFLYIRIADTGPGISAKEIDTIFQAYQRGTIANVKGAGLGLSISSQLAEKLGGKIEVSSRLGEGSIFTLSIEASLVDESEITKLSNTQAKTILVVEDDEDLVELLKIYLNDLGHHAVVAIDGERALQIIKQEQVGLVLLDMQLPNINGLEVVKRLKQFSKKIPVIGMSVSLDSEDKARALAAGCCEYLAKPIQVSLLKHTINLVLLKND